MLLPLEQTGDKAIRILKMGFADAVVWNIGSERAGGLKDLGAGSAMNESLLASQLPWFTCLSPAMLQASGRTMCATRRPRSAKLRNSRLRWIVAR